MLEKATLVFLKALKKHNDREWFDKNRMKYEAAKDDFGKFVGALLPELSRINPVLNSLEVKDCVFRIYRDVRFSKNKAPYKTNMGAYFVEGGKKSQKAGFYIQMEPGGSFIAGGCWMPPAPVLKAIRQEIDYNLDEFKRTVGAKEFRKLFNGLSETRLKTTPKGYSADHPGIDFLRQTSFIAQTPLADADFTSKTIVKKCAAQYKVMKPFLDFLNRSMD